MSWYDHTTVNWSGASPRNILGNRAEFVHPVLSVEVESLVKCRGNENCIPKMKA